MTRYWRIRMRNYSGEHSQAAWDADQVGIWYGAWTASDFNSVSSDKDARGKLNNLPNQKTVGFEITDSYFNTAKRFFESVTADDWAVVYLRESGRIGLGQIAGGVQSKPDHALNTVSGEIFKFRTLKNKKTFPIDQLPDAYRLVASQGRGNVHEYNTLYDHIKLLVNHGTASDVVAFINTSDFEKQLDLMGASGWESFCFSWLIMEKDFVPTGLSVGRTMKTEDIVGRSRSTGQRITAQCKKDAEARAMDPDFVRSCDPRGQAYYFAFGGCTGHSAHDFIRVITGKDALHWAQTTGNGRLYRRLFMGLDIDA